MTYEYMLAEIKSERAKLERVHAELKAERERIQALVLMLENLRRAS